MSRTLATSTRILGTEEIHAVCDALGVAERQCVEVRVYVASGGIAADITVSHDR